MHRHFLLQALATTALAAMLGACGHGNAPARGAVAAVDAAATGSASPGPVATTSTPTDCSTLQSQPITPADIDLYLDVMRAAASRVQHPTAADLAALKQQQTIDAQSSAIAEANAPAMSAIEASRQKLQAELQVAMAQGDAVRIKQIAAQQTRLAQALGRAVQSVPTLDDATYQIASDLSNGHADQVIVRERHLDGDHWDCMVDLIEEIFPPPTAVAGDCGGNCAPDLTPEQQRRAHERELAVARDRKVLAPYAATIRNLIAVVRNGKV